MTSPKGRSPVLFVLRLCGVGDAAGGAEAVHMEVGGLAVDEAWVGVASGVSFCVRLAGKCGGFGRLGMKLCGLRWPGRAGFGGLAVENCQNRCFFEKTDAFSLARGH